MDIGSKEKELGASAQNAAEWSRTVRKEEARPVPSLQSMRPSPYPLALDLHREINQHPASVSMTLPKGCEMQQMWVATE